MQDITQVLGSFGATKAAKPELTDKELLEKFPEFKGNQKLLDVAHSYIATRDSGKYSNELELNSKYPEFFTTKTQGGIPIPKTFKAMPLSPTEADETIYSSLPGEVKFKTGAEPLNTLGVDVAMKNRFGEYHDSATKTVSVPENSINNDIKPVNIPTSTFEEAKKGEYMDILSSKPQEKGFMSTGVGDFIEKFEAGSIDLLGNTFGALNNLPSIVLGLPTPDKTSFQVAANEVAEYVRRKADRYKGKDFQQLWKEGDKLGATGEIALQGGESLPGSLLAMFGGGAGLAVTGLSAQTQQYDSLRDRTDLSEDAKRINSTLNGMIQVGSEYLGDVPIGKLLKGMATKTSANAVGNAVGQGVKGWIATGYKKLGLLFPPVGEGLEEIAAQVGTNVTDYITGAREDWAPMEGALKAGVYGMGAGAGFSVAGGMIGVHNKVTSQQNYNKADTKLTATLSEYGLSRNDVNEIKESFMSSDPSTRNVQVGAIVSEMMPKAIIDGNINPDVAKAFVGYFDSLDASNEVAKYEKNKQLKRENEITTAQQQATEEVQSQVNPDMDAIVYVKLQGVEKPVRAFKGQLNVDQEGKIDESNSSRNIYYVDGTLDANGMEVPKLVHIAMVESLASHTPTQQATQQAVQGVTEELQKKHANEERRPYEIDETVRVELAPNQFAIGKVTGTTENGYSIKLQGMPEAEYPISQIKDDENIKGLQNEDLVNYFYQDGQERQGVFQFDEEAYRQGFVYVNNTAVPIENISAIKKVEERAINDVSTAESSDGTTETKPVEGETVPAQAEPLQTQYPTKKDGSVDYENMTDAQIFNHTKETKGEEAAHSLINRQVKRLQGQIQENTKATSKLIEETNKLLSKAKTMQQEIAIQAKQEAKAVSLKDEAGTLSAKLGELQSYLPKVEAPVQVETRKVVNLRPEEIQRRKEEAEQAAKEAATLDTPSESLTPNLESSIETLTPPKKSITPFQKRQSELGEYIDMEDYILRAIAGGQKFKWKSDGVKKGMADELGFGDKNGERLQRRNLIDEQNGLTPSEFAHSIWNDYGTDGNGGEIPGVRDMSDHEILDSVNEVLLSTKSNSHALEQAEAKRKFDMSDEDYSVFENMTPEQQNYVESIPNEILESYLGITNFTPEQLDIIQNLHDEYYGNDTQPTQTSTSERNQGLESETTGTGSEQQSIPSISESVSQGIDREKSEISGRTKEVATELKRRSEEALRNARKDSQERAETRLDNRRAVDDKPQRLSLGTIAESDGFTSTVTNANTGGSTSPILSTEELEELESRGVNPYWNNNDFRKGLRKQAKQNGVWLDSSFLDGKELIHDQKKTSTSENDVYSNPERTTLTKLNNLSYVKGAERQYNLSATIDRLQAHNELFPEAAYTVKGFMDNQHGVPSLAMEQPFIKNIERNATKQEIDQHLTGIGFKLDGIRPWSNGHQVWSNGVYELFDARPANVLKGKDGTLYFIDTFPHSVEYMSIQDTKPTQAQFDTQELDNYISEQEHNTNPTEKQKESGIYPKARVNLQHHNITIETLKGTERSGIDEGGQKWSVTMQNHYGELDGTVGYDGDAIDVFIGSNPKQGHIFVIDQVNKNGSFDESKVMLGFDTAEQAKAAYMSNYSEGWDGFGSITPAGDNFKEWLYDGKKQRKPFSEYKDTPEAIEKGSLENEVPGQTKILEKITTGEYSKGKVVEEAKTEKIEDFGEVIHGAKKHLATKNTSTNEDIASMPLSKSFPKPNFQQLVEDGQMTVDGAIAMNFIYENIPSKPRKNYRISSWIGKVQGAIDSYNLLLANNDKSGDVIEKLRQHMGEFKLYEATLKSLGFPQNNVSMGGYRIHKFHGRDDYSIVNGSVIISDHNTLEDAAKSLSTIINRTKEKSTDTKLSIYKDTKTNQYFIGKKGSGKVVRLMNAIETLDDARKIFKEQQPQLQQMWSDLKVNVNERRSINSPRIGTDYRNGKDITPEDFNIFGFRGVQFGNYVNSNERQLALNEAYDALYDLSNVIGLSPKALSLGSELGIAFGARGSGGKNSFSAHYEPDQIVINLTKNKGAGSLAHEWWHAVDNYFERQRGRKANFLTNSPSTRFNQDGSKDLRVREEVVEAFKTVVNAIKKSGIGERSEVLDQTRSKEYWRTAVEMSARSFENYIIEKLGERGQKNDYLANFKALSEWVNDGGLDMESYPYPTVEETPEINKAFDNLFNTIEEDDNGVLHEPKLEYKKTIIDSTINIDGVERPTTNSNGKPIHSTEEGIRNFYKWFGDSKVVDESGRPLVVYHGTISDFDKFDLSHTGKNSDSGVFGKGFYFSNDSQYSNSYSTRKDVNGSVMPIYLSMKNPLVINSLDDIPKVNVPNETIEEMMNGPENYSKLFREKLINQGNDGVIAYGDEFVAFNPDQAKSATGNNGEFDGNNPNILHEHTQLFINFTPEEITDEINKAHGSKEQQQQGIDKTIAEATKLPTNTGIRIDTGRTGNISPIYSKRTVIDGFRESGYIDFNGQEVKSHQDIADMWSIHRSPYIEKSHIIFIKDGKVAGTMALTSGRIDSTLVHAVDEIASHANKLGSTQVYLLHNHPSGNPSPSSADIRLTFNHAGELWKSNIDVLGQIVVDHDKYSFIDTKKEWPERLDNSMLLEKYANNVEQFEYKSEKPILQNRGESLGDGSKVQERMFEYGKNLLSQPEYKAAVVYLRANKYEGFHVAAYDVLPQEVTTDEIIELTKKGIFENLGTYAVIVHDGSIKRLDKLPSKVVDVVDITMGKSGYTTPFTNEPAASYNKNEMWVHENKPDYSDFNGDVIAFADATKKYNDFIAERNKTVQKPLSLQEPLSLKDEKTKEYTTQDGETISYVSTHDGQYTIAFADDVQQQGNESGSNSFERITYIERELNEQKHLSLTGATKVKDPSDIAFLFRHLESAASENVFVHMVDGNNKQKVLYLSTGNSHSSIIDVSYIAAAAKEFGAKSVCMVHNHPSGQLIPSTQDHNCHSKIIETFKGTGVKVKESVIINLDSGKFATFKKSDYSIEETEANKKLSNPTSNIPVYAFDKQKLYTSASERTGIKGSSDVAQFLSTIKRGTVEKYLVLVLGSGNHINSVSATNTLNPQDIVAEIGKHGNSVIIVGNTMERFDAIDLQEEIKKAGGRMLDYIAVEPSQDIVESYKGYADSGLLNTPQAEYNAEPVTSEVRERSIEEILVNNGENLPEEKIEKLKENVKVIANKLWEGWADMALPVKEYQSWLEKQGMEISDNDNYYMKFTAVPSRIESRFDLFKKEQRKPFLDTLKKMQKNGFTYDDIATYAKLKHADEYTAHILIREYTKTIESERAKIDDVTGSKDWTSKHQKLDQKIIDFKSTIYDYIKNNGIDYAGKEAIEKRIEENADDFIANFETENGSLATDFWKQSASITHYALDEEVRAGIRTKESAQAIKGMFEYYVPLKGHRDVTAEDLWDYTAEHGDFFFSAVKKGKGRKSESDDPFSVMESTVRSAIGQAEENILLQSLLRLAFKDTTGTMSVNKTWFIKVGEEDGKAIFEIAPEVVYENNDTQETYNAKVEKFEQKMRGLAEQGEAYQGKIPKLKLGVWIKPTNTHEHDVTVRRNGESYTIRFNTSPRIPQAINGTNARHYEGAVGKALEAVGTATRHMAGFKTVWRPSFILVTNPLRDIHAVLNLAFIDEGAAFTGNVIKNFPHAVAALTRHQLGKSDYNNKYDKMYLDFLMQGGKTGISKIMELKQVQKSIEKQLEGGFSVKDKVFDMYHAISDITENQARMAVYITAIDKGYSVIKATSMAKEATLNFDRKGNGRNGLREMKSTMAFINVGFQAIDNVYGKSTKNSETKKRALVAIAANVLGGALLVSMLSSGLCKLFGSDEDEWLDDLSKLTSFERNANFCIWTPNGLVKIPLGQEFRVYHALGMDMMMMYHGKTTGTETAVNMIKGLSSLVPYNPIEGMVQRGSYNPVTAIIGAVDVLTPFSELGENKNWLGSSIFKQNQDANAPGYTKIKTTKKGDAYAPEMIIKLSKMIDNVTGGDGVKKGFISPNPDIVHHLLGGYLAGIYEQPLSISEGALSEKDGSLLKELTPRAVWKSRSDIKERNTGLNEDFYKAKEADKENDRLIKGYRDQLIEKLNNGADPITLADEANKIQKLITPQYKSLNEIIKTITTLEGKLDKVPEESKNKVDEQINILKELSVAISKTEDEQTIKQLEEEAINRLSK